VPGTYDIYYYHADADVFWPSNTNALLQSGVDLTTSKTVTVDIPAVDITFELTIDGQAPTAQNTNAYDEGGLRLVNTASDETLELPDAYNNGDIRYPTTRRLVPGTYNVYYYHADADVFWPSNTNAPLTCFGVTAP
jgi:hypothetical protein